MFLTLLRHNTISSKATDPPPVPPRERKILHTEPVELPARPTIPPPDIPEEYKKIASKSKNPSGRQLPNIPKVLNNFLKTYISDSSKNTTKNKYNK